MNLEYKVIFKFSFVVLMVIILSGCAAHQGPFSGSQPYGFFSGILHGFIFPFSLIGKSIIWFLSFVGFNITEEIQFVGRPNTGIFFYYIGYALGLSFWFGGSSAKSR